MTEPTTAPTTSTRFRLLHGSDLHFNARTGLDKALSPLSAHDPAAAEAFARAAWQLGGAGNVDDAVVDALLLSGDLGTSGDAADLALAHRYLSAPAVDRWLAADRTPTLMGAQLPTGLLPGNHDRFKSYLLPGNRAFDEVFAAWWRDPDRDGVDELLVLDKDHRRLVLLGLDLTLRDVADGLIYMGQGRAYQDVVDAAVDATRWHRQAHEHVAVVWVSHFPPEAPLTLMLVDDTRLVAGARTAGVPLLLCGHTHVEKAFVDTIPVVTAPTTTVLEPGNTGYVIHTLDVGDGGALTHSTQLSRYIAAEARYGAG